MSKMVQIRDLIDQASCLECVFGTFPAQEAASQVAQVLVDVGGEGLERLRVALGPSVEQGCDFARGW